MTSYIVDAERSGTGWILQARDVPGAVSFVRSLAVAEAHTREAISLMLDVPEDSFDVDLQVKDIPPTVLADVRAAREATRAAEAATFTAARMSRGAVTALVEAGLKNAEIAALLKVSPQRVGQLVPARAKPKPAVPAPVRAAKAAPAKRSVPAKKAVPVKASTRALPRKVEPKRNPPEPARGSVRG